MDPLTFKHESARCYVTLGSACEIVATLPDGFYFFKDPDLPELWGMIERLDGNTWRIGEERAIANNDWDERVTFYPAIPPNYIISYSHENNRI